MPCGGAASLHAAQAATPGSTEEQRLRARLREIAGEHPRWGWKTAHEILLRGGWTINRKRTRRIWRQEGLRRPVRTRKRRRVGQGQKQRLRATHAGHVWAIDFMFDETSDRRRLKLCNIVDEYTREALAIRVDRTCTAEDLVAVIEDLVLTRGAPEYLRADNGPEMIAWVLRDYCRLAGTMTAYIEPGSPWEKRQGRVRCALCPRASAACTSLLKLRAGKRGLGALE
ncbi:MAG: DDE-type integrase/transposase/recombinase [Solirubrobacteraceae bacterium]